MTSHTRVRDYRTGETLEGTPDDRLIEESEATPEGAVCAYYEEADDDTDEGVGLGVWHWCDWSMLGTYRARGVNVRTVYVSCESKLEG